LQGKNEQLKVKDIILHLRFPFSLFLMPVYWFAISQAQAVNIEKAIWIFVILHLLIYPASNAYNSYFDKDEGSIGGLKNPPKVTRALFQTAIRVDGLGFILALFLVDVGFGLAVFIYSMVSRAYSYDKIRLKKYPVVSWIIVGLFQGAFTYLMVYHYSQHTRFDFTYLLSNTHVLLAAFVSTVMLWAVYPLTQVYQHEQDAKNGDTTLSMLLGIKGTFLFSGIVFTLCFLCYYLYFDTQIFIKLLLFNLPSILFFNWWVYKVFQNESNANFSNTMRMNILASLCLNLFYLWLVIY
jgi:1,4-dihydroxy-2-naphthoate octaprenyltransferase